ncbi:MAG: ArnT family glycosyltransferase [Hyphomonadaceae bacterium]
MPSQAPAKTLTLAFWAMLGGVLAIRLYVLAATPLELQYDEAQYWFWSLTPDWGYFSKPPLIAWAIWATTHLFGEAEWAVRLAAPLAQAGAAVILYSFGRAAYGAQAGFWAGVGWLLMPAVWLSSAVISTDALLIPLWACALFALWRLVETRGLGWALALGAAIGLGALAKYAMLYFLLCAVIAMVWAAPVRRTLVSLNGAIALAVAALILAPNLAWNAAHQFATIEHTAANAEASSWALHPEELGEFLSGQTIVVGPIFLLALIYLFFWGAPRAKLDLRDKFFIAFSAPPLAIILVQALISHAHANWAVTAYPAALIWIAGRFSQGRAGVGALIASNGLHLALGAVTMAAALSPAFANRIGLGNALEDGRGWRETARLVAQRVDAHRPLSAVATDHRAIFFELSYYRRRLGQTNQPPLRMWLLRDQPHNHAEAVAPLTAQDSARVLFVHAQARYLEEVNGDFAKAQLLDSVSLPLGGGQTRELTFSIEEGYRRAPRDAAFLRRIGD